MLGAFADCEPPTAARIFFIMTLIGSILGLTLVSHEI